MNNDNLKNNWLLRGSSLLLTGLFLLLISDMRGSADLFAWFMLIPFLLYVTLYHGVKSRLWLLLTLVTGSILVLAKTTSQPVDVSLGFSIMTGTVIGLRYFITFLAWDYIRKWAGNRISLVAFPVVVVSIEYLQAFLHHLGPGARWLLLRSLICLFCNQHHCSDFSGSPHSWPGELLC